MVTDVLKIGAAAPAFKDLPGTDGRNHSLDDFKDGNILVVVFSCNHCPYVQAYEDRMIAFVKAYAAKGVRMVVINSNDIKAYPEDDFNGMVKRAALKGYNFLYLRDEDQKVAEVFGASHTPEFFVFDGRQKLCYHGKFDDNYKEPQSVKRRYVQEAVDALLAGTPVVEPETHSIGCTIKWR